MIPVGRVPEPAAFDHQCRLRGRDWLTGNAGAKRPRDYWSPFKVVLATGFQDRCGYTAMYEPVGSIDHFQSWHRHPELAYEWSNYRFVAEWVNKSKQTADDVLDPFDVKPGWFEISLPDLQLKVTDRVPAPLRALAEHTLVRLHLRDDERVIRQRRSWLALYESGDLSIGGLDQVAPLIAEAVRRREAASDASQRTVRKRAVKKPARKQPRPRARSKRPRG